MTSLICTSRCIFCTAINILIKGWTAKVTLLWGPRVNKLASLRLTIYPFEVFPVASMIFLHHFTIIKSDIFAVCSFKGEKTVFISIFDCELFPITLLIIIKCHSSIWKSFQIFTCMSLDTHYMILRKWFRRQVLAKLVPFTKLEGLAGVYVALLTHGTVSQAWVAAANLVSVTRAMAEVRQVLAKLVFFIKLEGLAGILMALLFRATVSHAWVAAANLVSVARTVTKVNNYWGWCRGHCWCFSLIIWGWCIDVVNFGRMGCFWFISEVRSLIYINWVASMLPWSSTLSRAIFTLIHK